MTEVQPSLTAFRVAARRAAHQVLDEPLVFVDPLATTIVGPEATAAACAPVDTGLAQFGLLLRAFLVARSRIAEDEVARAVDAGIRQYVVLGAGLDTFAYRNPFPDLRVFEVDRPATQSWKRARLAETGIAPASTLQFVPVNFSEQDLGDELAAHGFQPGAGAIFSWLGVTPYLERETVIRTLASIARLAGPGGGVVFDYGIPLAVLTDARRAMFKALMDRLRTAGEPWITFFEPADLACQLAQCGFHHVKDWQPDDINAHLFANRADGLRVGVLGRIVVAEV